MSCQVICILLRLFGIKVRSENYMGMVLIQVGDDGGWNQACNSEGDQNGQILDISLKA